MGSQAPPSTLTQSNQGTGVVKESAGNSIAQQQIQGMPFPSNYWNFFPPPMQFQGMFPPMHGSMMPGHMPGQMPGQLPGQMPMSYMPMPNQNMALLNNNQFPMQQNQAILAMDSTKSGIPNHGNTVHDMHVDPNESLCFTPGDSTEGTSSSMPMLGGAVDASQTLEPSNDSVNEAPPAQGEDMSVYIGSQVIE